MQVTELLAKHFHDLHFGGNWTSVHLQAVLSDVSQGEALRKHADFNTIAALAYHIHYYTDTLLRVLRGGPLDAHDRFSFDHPPLDSPERWNAFLEHLLETARQTAAALAALPEEKLEVPFVEHKYGSYYRNIQGTIEHAHYHLGQIVLLKKMLRQEPLAHTAS